MIFNLNQMVKYPVEEEWIETGKKEAEYLKGNYGRKTVEIYENRDVIGVIGREALRKWCEEKYFSANFSELKPIGVGDTEDVFIQGVQFDVKTIYSKNYEPNLLYNVRIYEHQIEKSMDAYIFAQWAEELKTAWIVGWCPRSYFLKYAYYLPKGTKLGNYTSKTGSYELEIHRLFPVSDFSQENYEALNR